MNRFESLSHVCRWITCSDINSGAGSWVGSLLVKLACLGAGVLFVGWVGWSHPSLPSDSEALRHPAGLPLSPVRQAGLPGPTARMMPVARHADAAIVDPVPAVGGGGSDHLQDIPAFVVDLNTGTLAELEQLPGIGTALAGRIIAHRGSHGAFHHIEDLVRVRGIGEKRLQQLRPFVSVQESTSGLGS